MQRNGASPGGPAISAAKKRRLAMLDETLQASAKQQQPQAGGRQLGRPDSKPAGGRNSAVSTVPAAAATVDAVRPKDGDFPYNRLGEAVLDGSLSSALAQAKAAAQAAAAATSAAFGGPASDLRSLLSQRLQDRSVLLDNPMAALNAKKMFARRTSSYSAKLRSNTETKRRAAAAVSAAGESAADHAAAAEPRKGAPSFETMLRVHELWNQYTQGLVRNAPAGAAASSATAAAAAAAKVADLHGARVTVVQHRNPQLVGASGVVLRRSTAALHVVTPGDRVKVVPLKGCAAQYVINGIVLQLTG
eukprot:XP_001691819.1 predicted protein [Chlamydomonas reinhardtii]